MFGGKVIATIGFTGADDDQRENRKKTLPDGTTGIQLDQSCSFCIAHVAIPLSFNEKKLTLSRSIHIDAYQNNRSH
jgi:hypothetical protein